MAKETKLEDLPGDCMVQILCLTSPRDACRSSLISRAVHAVAESDLLWESFLPPDYQEILSRLVTPVAFRSKKELFLRLCTPRLTDGGRKSFSIERRTGKKCYMLSARSLSITWSSNSLYWCWKPFARSRFGEAAELVTVSWLEIRGKLNTRLLSPRTAYAAYLIADVADRAYGLDSLPSEVSVEVGGKRRSRGSVYLRRGGPSRRDSSVDTVRMRKRVEAERVLRDREDGWLEIELGEFYCDIDGGDEEVTMSLKEVKGEHLKGGLIVKGIEVRPIS
ncbi:hypothetical protein NMG60_11020843 [Bertholletia excelsa]